MVRKCSEIIGDDRAMSFTKCKGISVRQDVKMHNSDTDDHGFV